MTSMLTKARIDCLVQIHRAGYALRWRDGWSVNGWTGKGPTQHGPTERMIQTLIDGVFVGYVKSRNAHCPEIQLTPFGVVAVLENTDAATKEQP